MWYVFFLFLKKMERNRVKSVWSKFMISNDYLHHVNLNSSFDVNIFRHGHSKGFNLQSLVFYTRNWILKSSKFCKIVHLESHSSFDNVWNIEILSVVTCDEIWVNLLHKISPCIQKFFFCVKTENSTSNNWSARFECENVTDKRFFFSKHFYNISNLYHWIFLS